MYSRDNIKEAIKEGHLKIIPFEEKNLTGIGYNLSTTNFAFSINQGLLLQINTDTTEEGHIHYIEIPANDTVLFFSKEFLETDNTIAGTFHSKVSRVCQGFGHISTTLDPMWKGQLIIAVSNSTDKKIRFDLDRNSGNIFTLLLYKLDNAVTGNNVHDNNQGRCDLLLSHFTENFSSKFHKKKHFELENFIVKEFANSLNGYDDFLVNDIQDKYTKKLKNLIDLREQLNKDKLLIWEDRYELGKNGVYHILRDEKQRETIRECSIFHLSNLESRLSDVYDEKEFANASSDIIKMIERYLMIIGYEMETINHNRRVSWQNERIAKYATENSKILQYRKRKRFLLKLGIIVALAVILYILVILGYSFFKNNIKDTDLYKIILTGFVTIISGIIVNSYKGKK